MTAPDTPDDLEAPENWDWDAAIAQPAAPVEHIIVSVSLSRAEFECIAERAEREGMTLTAFVRAAALAAAKDRGRMG